MNTMAILAVTLIIIGVIALAYGGVTFTTKEKGGRGRTSEGREGKDPLVPPTADRRRGVADRRNRPTRGQPAELMVARRRALDTVAGASARAVNAPVRTERRER